MKQHADSLVCPFGVAEALEEGAEDDRVCLQAPPEETAEEDKL